MAISRRKRRKTCKEDLVRGVVGARREKSEKDTPLVPGELLLGKDMRSMSVKKAEHPSLCI
jgi:hypothetical protein